MFYYNIYGKIVAVNLKLTLLKTLEKCEYYDLKVNVKYEPLDGNSVYIRGSTGRIDIKLGSLALYSISPERNIISCTAQNYEAFFSTFVL